MTPASQPSNSEHGAPGLDSDTGHVRVDGGALYYEVAGSGTPVVLIHGGNLDSRMWDEQFAALAREHRVIRYDVRGFGRSSAANVSYAAHDDLLALLDSLHVRNAAFVGLSLGGRIAIDFALAHAERVTRLILAAPGLSGWHFSAADTSWVPNLREAYARGDSVGMATAWLGSEFMKPAMEQPRLRGELKEWIKTGAGNWMGLFRHGDLERAASPVAFGRTQMISAPTLVIVGSRDTPDIRHIADTLVATIPLVRRLDIPDAGHLLNLESPDQFTAAIREFLSAAPR